MVNATEMAKPFGKLPADFLRLKSTGEFIDALRSAMGIPIAEESVRLVYTINGGNRYGTWMHDDLAVEFARWLSPKFAIWCNDRIKELMKHGFTASEHTLDELLSNPDLLIGVATQLKKQPSDFLRLKSTEDFIETYRSSRGIPRECSLGLVESTVGGSEPGTWMHEDIRNMEPAWEKINGSKFGLVDYIDEKGENQPMYQLSKLESLYISTKFNDEARAKLILRWEKCSALAGKH